jgi:hypothetical protein
VSGGLASYHIKEYCDQGYYYIVSLNKDHVCLFFERFLVSIQTEALLKIQNSLFLECLHHRICIPGSAIEQQCAVRRTKK